MSTDWDGASLQTEFSLVTLMRSTAEKATLLAWMNEVQLDIARRFDWPFLRYKGKKLLTVSTEQQNLVEAGPGAATAAIASGGSLVASTNYKIVVTFVDSNGLETVRGTESSAVTADASNKTISLSSIPVSSETLVTARRIYVSKDDDGGGTYGAYLFDQEISDNTTTTATITSETTSTIEPPDYNSIMKLDGDPFFEATLTNKLVWKSPDYMRSLEPQAWTDGTPTFWSEMGSDRVILNPRPSSAVDLSFYYFQRPKRIYAESYYNRTLDLPPDLKPLLRAGVIKLAYEYSDRAGVESKIANYEELMRIFISKYTEAANVTKRVTDVYGDSSGFSY